MHGNAKTGTALNLNVPAQGEPPSTLGDELIERISKAFPDSDVNENPGVPNENILDDQTLGD